MNHVAAIVTIALAIILADYVVAVLRGRGLMP